MNKDEFKKIICEKKFLLPPLSRYTDYPYRQILARFKPSFIITEMVNARAVIEKNDKTMQMLKMEDGFHLKGSQLVGDDPLEMKDAAVILEALGFDYIDINMGCTVKKVVSKGQGIALMKNESLACKIVESVSDSVDVPVMVKMRIGYSSQEVNAASLSKKLEKAGASAITIHGRSGDKKFGTKLDYEIIQKVSSLISIPVIANGGINGFNVLDVLNKTNASAVMPGRSIIGNPWIIPEIQSKFNDTTFVKPHLEEIKNIVLDHVHYLSDFYGEFSGIRQSRKFLPKYFSSCKYINNFKNDVISIRTINDVERLLNKMKIDNGFWIYDG